MLNSEIQLAINKQINQEITAAYYYLGMSAHFEQQSLAGIAKWFLLQYEEEWEHAMRLFRYLLDRGGEIELTEVEAVPCSYETTVKVFKTALRMEEENTSSINDLYELALKKQDHATVSHLQWFLDEQVEEEALMNETLSLAQCTNENPQALLYLNDKLGQRKPENEIKE